MIKMKKTDKKIICYISMIGILTCMSLLIGIQFAKAGFPDEWIVASSFSYYHCEHDSGTIEDTYYNDGEYLTFYSDDWQIMWSYYYFGSIHAKSLKIDATYSGGIFAFMTLYVYYTTGNPQTFSFPAGFKQVTLDSNRYLYRIAIKFDIGYFVWWGYQNTDYISVLATFN